MANYKSGRKREKTRTTATAHNTTHTFMNTSEGAAATTIIKLQKHNHSQ